MIMTLLHVITASWRSYKTVFRLWKSSKAQIWHHEVEMRVEISTLFRIRCFFLTKTTIFWKLPWNDVILWKSQKSRFFEGTDTFSGSKSKKSWYMISHFSQISRFWEIHAEFAVFVKKCPKNGCFSAWKKYRNLEGSSIFFPSERELSWKILTRFSWIRSNFWKKR